MGQINGLAVMQLSDVGLRCLRVLLQRASVVEKVIDIERETKLGGNHLKGYSSFHRFWPNVMPGIIPVTSASLVFEQSYGRIEGDSASMAELMQPAFSVVGLPIRRVWR
ncbi:MAG: hypothetical protein H6937_11830 [Burkholderiales bacterium]|nr:hypothetical protein [Burkholderiales bacterium]